MSKFENRDLWRCNVYDFYIPIFWRKVFPDWEGTGKKGFLGTLLFGYVGGGRRIYVRNLTKAEYQRRYRRRRAFKGMNKSIIHVPMPKIQRKLEHARLRRATCGLTGMGFSQRKLEE